MDCTISKKRFENFVYHAIGPITTAILVISLRSTKSYRFTELLFLNDKRETTTTIASLQQQPNIYGELNRVNIFGCPQGKKIPIFFLKKSFKKTNKKFGKSLKTKTPKKNKTFVYVL
jgi:hypothetical protein